MVIKRYSQLWLFKSHFKTEKIVGIKANLFLLLTQVYDNYIYVIKGEQAMDIKKIRTDEPISMLSDISLSSTERH